MELLPNVRAHDVDTARLRMHVYESGPEDGEPVLLLHGNLSTGRFYEEVLSAAPERYRLIAPDLRGFGRTQRATIDATRGLRDWSDDAAALLEALGVTAVPHVAGWSTGGGAAATWALDRPARSVTLIDPVSPFGFGGTFRDGSPCFPDFAGSGGGTAAPEFVESLRAGDRGDATPFTARNVLNSAYWSAAHREPPEREDLYVDEVLLTDIGDDGYPGTLTPSDNWPGIAPGTTGLLNALSPKYCNWSGIVDVDPKPPILWTHGTVDIVIADASAFDLGTLGQAGQVPGWPGADVFPPQLMVTQIHDVLERYRNAGGRADEEHFEGSGHFPVLDAAKRWQQTFFDFLASVG